MMNYNSQLFIVSRNMMMYLMLLYIHVYII